MNNINKLLISGVLSVGINGCNKQDTNNGVNSIGYPVETIISSQAVNTMNCSYTNFDEILSSDVCMVEGKYKILIDKIMVDTLDIGDNLVDIERIRNKEEVLKYIDFLRDKLFFIKKQDYVDDNNKIIIDRLLLILTNLESDIHSNNGILKNDYKVDHRFSKDMFLLYIYAKNINENYSGFSEKSLYREFSIFNKDKYGFYYSGTHESWYKTGDYSTQYSLVDILSVVEGFDSLIRVYDRQATRARIKYPTDIVSKIQIKLGINKVPDYKDLMKILYEGAEPDIQDYAIKHMLDLFDTNNITGIQGIGNNIKFNDEINFDNLLENVTIFSVNNPNIDKFLQQLSPESQQLITGGNLKYILFIPYINRNMPTPAEPNKIGDVLGLSIGGGVVFIDSNYASKEEIFNTVAHEFEHTQHARMFGEIGTLREESVANVYGTKEMEYQFNKSGINILENNMYLKEIDLLKRSDFLLDATFNSKFDSVYPSPFILGISLVNNINYSDLSILEAPSFYEQEIIEEFNAAKKIGMVYLDEGISNVDKGAKFLEIIQSEQSTDIEKINAKYALGYLFPDKYLNIPLDKVIQISDGVLNWDNIVSVHQGVLKGNIKLAGKGNIYGDFKGIYGITLDGNIYDFSEITSHGNTEVSGKVTINGDVHSGNHSHKGNNSGNLEMELNGKNLNIHNNISSQFQEELIKSGGDKLPVILKYIDLLLKDIDVFESTQDNNELVKYISNIKSISELANNIQYELQLIISDLSNSELKENLINTINDLRDIFNDFNNLETYIMYINGTSSIQDDLATFIDNYKSFVSYYINSNVETVTRNIVNDFNSGKISRSEANQKFYSILLEMKPYFNTVKSLEHKINIYFKYLNESDRKHFDSLIKKNKEIKESSYKMWNLVAHYYDQTQ